MHFIVPDLDSKSVIFKSLTSNTEYLPSRRHGRTPSIEHRTPNIYRAIGTAEHRTLNIQNPFIQ